MIEWQLCEPMDAPVNFYESVLRIVVLGISVKDKCERIVNGIVGLYLKRCGMG